MYIYKAKNPCKEKPGKLHSLALLPPCICFKASPPLKSASKINPDIPPWAPAIPSWTWVYSARGGNAFSVDNSLRKRGFWGLRAVTAVSWRQGWNSRNAVGIWKGGFGRKSTVQGGFGWECEPWIMAEDTPAAQRLKRGSQNFHGGSSVPCRGWNEIPGIVGIGALRGTRHQQELKALRHQECEEEDGSHPCACFSWKAVPPDAALYKAKCTLPPGRKDGGMPWEPGVAALCFPGLLSQLFFLILGWDSGRDGGGVSFPGVWEPWNGLGWKEPQG